MEELKRFFGRMSAVLSKVLILISITRRWDAASSASAQDLLLEMRPGSSEAMSEDRSTTAVPTR